MSPSGHDRLGHDAPAGAGAPLSVTRRRFLSAGAALAGAALLPASLLRSSASAAAFPAPAPAARTKQVVLVLFAGGVRSRDTILAPKNVPSLMRLAERGVVLPNLRTSNLGHFAASLAILTGVPENFGIRDNERGASPTLFEYMRRQLSLPASSAWLSTNNGAQGANFAYSLHRQWGAPYGANVIDGDGVFNQEFRETLGQLGTPKPDSNDDASRLARLRGAIGAGAPAGSARAVNDDATAARIERYLQDELTRSETATLTGPGAGDAKAIRIAASIVRLFRPALTCISLTSADVAHGSYNAYVDVLRRNDQELGKLLDFVDQDRELAATTSFFVLPEFGRDRNLNQRNGLDHGDGSEELQKVACIAAGPDLKVAAGKTVRDDASTLDVCPTIARLLGFDAPLARGRVLPRLLG